MNRQFLFKKIGIVIVVLLLIFSGTSAVGLVGFAQDEAKTDEESTTNGQSIEKEEESDTPKIEKGRKEETTVDKGEEQEEKTLVEHKLKASESIKKEKNEITSQRETNQNHLRQQLNQSTIQPLNVNKQDGDFKYRVESSGTITITGYKGKSEDVLIPNKIENKPVTVIGNYAFTNQSLKSVTLNENLETIEQYAFSNNQLKNLILPDSLKSIGSHAFYFNSLESVKFGENLETIEKSAFVSNQLKNLILPDSLKSIGSHAFYLNSLESVKFGENLETIGNYAFIYNPLKNITLPDSLKIIGASAFENNALKTVTFGKNLETIEENAFVNNQLKNITLPNSLKSIGNWAFSGNSLEFITFGENLETIGKGAFAYNQLKNITLPNSLKSIEERAFFTNSLEFIMFGENLENIEIGAFAYNPLKNITLPNSLKSIGEYAFFMNSLEFITFGQNLETIGNYAFSTNQLKNLILPDSLKSIGDFAFANNLNLERAIFQNDVQQIGEDVFYHYKGHSNFAIFGKVGTNVETYANDNKFIFIDINSTFKFVFEPNGSNNKWFKDIAVTVKIYGLSDLNLKYAWSESTDMPVKSEWKTFNNGATIKWNNDGKWYLHVHAKDDKGNEKSVYTNLFQIDKTPPTVTIEQNGNKTWSKTVSTKVFVTDNGSGLDETSLQYAWTTSSNISSNVNWISFENGTNLKKVDGNGTWFLHIRATDRLGNTTITTSNAFHLDNTEPEIKVTMKQDENKEYINDTWTNKNVRISVETTDVPSSISSFKIKINGEEEVIVGSSYQNIFNQSGKYHLVITVIDQAGNVTNEERLIKISKEDRLLLEPKLSTVEPQPKRYISGVWTNKDVTAIVDTINLDLKESSITTKYYTKEDNLWCDYKGPITFSKDGIHSVKFQAEDILGNIKTEDVEIRIDKTQPKVKFETDDIGKWTKETSTTTIVTDIGGSGVDEESLEYIWSTSENAPTDGKWKEFESGDKITKDKVNGTWYLHVRAKDYVGNEVIKSQVFKLDNTAPQLTLRGEKAMYISYGEPFQDPGYIVTDNLDKNIEEKVQIEGTVNTEKIGTYEITYRVTDHAGNNETKKRTINVIDDKPPVITLKGNSILNVIAGTSYQELGAVAKDNVEGDISSKIEISGEVNVNRLGIYQIRYNVSDAEGNIAEEVIREVHVVAPKEILLEIGKSAIQVFPGTLVKIKGTNSSILMPNDLPEGTTLKVELGNITVEGYKHAGEVFNFIFTFPSEKGNYMGNFILTLGVEQKDNNPAIYYYNEQTKSLERIGGEIDGNTIPSTVNHFSTYGVYSEIKKDETSKSDSKKELPKTAINIYNWLLIGVAFIFLAILILSTNKKRKIRK